MYLIKNGVDVTMAWRPRDDKKRSRQYTRWDEIDAYEGGLEQQGMEREGVLPLLKF